MFKRLGQGLLILLVVLVAAGIWKREEIVRLMAVNSLFDADRIVNNFSHMDTMFKSLPLSRGDGPVSPLAAGPAATLPTEVADWVKTRNVTALVVLKNGQLVHESYYQGTKPDDLRISWSMAKSALSMLFGTVVAEGKIASIDDPVVKYAPQLKGSAYEAASIRNVLTMSSGVKFNENYFDFWSDINRMGRVLALGGKLDDFAAGLKDSDNKPGTVWHYVSMDTHVIGMVIRGATGQSIKDLMEKRILAPLGLEKAPYYVTDGVGEPFVLGGLNMTTRDYARLGLLALNSGSYDGKQVVPADWMEQSTRAEAPGGAGYGFQWWIPKNAAPGEFYAIGVYGQYIYINRGKDVVIAVNAGDRSFEDPGVEEGNIELYRKIAGGL